MHSLCGDMAIKKAQIILTYVENHLTLRVFIKDLFILLYQNMYFIAKPKTVSVFSIFTPNLIAPRLNTSRLRQFSVLSRLKYIESCRVVSRVSSGVGRRVVHINDQPRTSTKQWLHISDEWSHASINNPTNLFVEARK